MSTARCHSCGRTYLTAQALAGKNIPCRSCGAENDGAGGPPNPTPAASGDAGRGGSKPGVGSNFEPFVVGPPLVVGRRGGPDENDQLEAELDRAFAAASTPPSRRSPIILVSGFLILVVAAVAVSALLFVNRQEKDKTKDDASESDATLVAEGDAAIVPDTKADDASMKTGDQQVVRADDVDPQLPGGVNTEPTFREGRPSDANDQTLTFAQRIQPRDTLVPNVLRDAVFASSILGLRDFDKRFLNHRSIGDAYAAISDAFVKRFPNLSAEQSDLSELIASASLQRSLIASQLHAKRPQFEIVFPDNAEGARVGIYIDVPEQSRHLFNQTADGLVSKSSDVELDKNVVSEQCRYDKDAAAFRVPLALPWNQDGLLRLGQKTQIPLSFRVVYGDNSVDTLRVDVTVQPPDEIEMIYPFLIGFASLVDERHPFVKSLVESINNDPRVVAAGMNLAGGGGNIDAQLESIALIWRELNLRGMRYQNLTGTESAMSQRCRLVHESLSSGNANCVDATVMLASFFQAIQLDTWLVFMPGHALVCVLLRDPGSASLLFIESTLMGAKIEGRPEMTPRYLEMFDDLRRRRPLLRGAEIENLQIACQSGENTILRHLADAQDLLNRYREMSRELQERQSDEKWMKDYSAVWMKLAQQLQLVPVSLARQNGVVSIGSPSDVVDRYRIRSRTPQPK
jgi:hypothetical protein